MPVLNGYQASKVIKRTWVKPPPIIALTADNTASAKKKCQDAGMDGFYIKPLTLQSLESVLSHVRL